jgi:WD40 repeat protein
MSDTPLLFLLSPAEVRRIDQLCDRFEAAWKAGQRPRPEDYLSSAEESLRPALLRQLLPLDWEYRLRAGEQPQAADYDARFPGAAALLAALGRESAATVDRTPWQPSSPSPATVTADSPVPRQLGSYRVVREVGRGGMGVVYEAVQESLGRRVALKVLAGPGPDHPARRERFRREAQLTAQLHHPNIVQIFEVGEQDGQPFLALEFVAGPRLAERLRDAPQSPRQAAALVETLARAMHHAHQQGVVHRDLKPANVLLAGGAEPSGGPPPPLAEYVPKVTDFGLAHPVGGGDLTATGEIVGTPSYMAPEQARGKNPGRPVGPATDTYALGAVLYECLTGRPPFQGPTPLDTVLLVQAEDPVPPSRLQPKCPRDLETVCLKCLEKDPRKRYPSAGELAEDLRRFLDGRPIQARPAGPLERAVKGARRRPAVAALLGVSAAAAVVVLSVVVSFSAALYRQNQDLVRSLGLQKQAEEAASLKAQEALDAAGKAAEREAEALQARKDTEAEKKKTEEQRDRVRSHLFTAQLKGVAAVFEKDPQAGLAVLHDCDACPIYQRDAAWRYYENACRGQQPLAFQGRGGSSSANAVALSPDGKTLALAGGGGAVELWDVLTGKKRAGLEGHVGGVLSVAFSPDGKTLASAGGGLGDGMRLPWVELKLWDPKTGRQRATLPAHAYPVYPGGGIALAFSPDGKTLASGSSERTVRLWDVDTGKERATIPGHEGGVLSVAFSPDGKTLASAGGDRAVRLWDVDTGKEHAALRGHEQKVVSVAFSPDGKTLASAGEDRAVRLWDRDSGKEHTTLKPPTPVNSVAFSPDGKTLATAGGGSEVENARLRTWGEVRLWDVDTGKERAALPGHEQKVVSVAFSPDGHVLASAGVDGMVRLWPMGPAQLHAAFPGHRGGVRSVAFSPDGKTLASGGDDQAVRLWDVVTGHERATLSGHGQKVLSVAFSPDGKTLAAARGGGGEGGAVDLWDVTAGKERATIPAHEGGGHSVAFSPDGKTLATSPAHDPTNEKGVTWGVNLWDVATGKERGTLKSPRVVLPLAFSPDGKTLAAGGAGEVFLWEVATGKRRIVPLGDDAGGVPSVAFSPDGKTLAAAVNKDDGPGGEVRLCDVASGKETATLKMPEASVLSVAYSPDGKALAAACASDGKGAEVKLWEAATGRERATLQGFREGDGAASVAFSPDGRFLASGRLDGTVNVWDVAVIFGTGQ